jgi:hypothetical protein
MARSITRAQRGLDGGVVAGQGVRAELAGEVDAGQHVGARGVHVDGENGRRLLAAVDRRIVVGRVLARRGDHAEYRAAREHALAGGDDAAVGDEGECAGKQVVGRGRGGGDAVAFHVGFLAGLTY